MSSFVLEFFKIKSDAFDSAYLDCIALIIWSLKFVLTNTSFDCRLWTKSERFSQENQLSSRSLRFIASPSGRNNSAVSLQWETAAQVGQKSGCGLGEFGFGQVCVSLKFLADMKGSSAGAGCVERSSPYEWSREFSSFLTVSVLCLTPNPSIIPLCKSPTILRETLTQQLLQRDTSFWSEGRLRVRERARGGFGDLGPEECADPQACLCHNLV